MRCLVTGANGFVGVATCRRLAEAGHQVVAAVRRPGQLPTDLAPFERLVGEVGPETDWTAALEGVGAVVHLVSPAQVDPGSPGGVEQAYRRIVVAGSLRLAEAAIAAGARRLVFMSTVKVNGEETAGTPFRESDEPRPATAYGAGKLAAERALFALAAERPIEVVAIRPPAVYGPGGKGNVMALLRLLDRLPAWVPLPLGGRNRRSLIYVGNLADAVLAALTVPAAAGRLYLVADGPPVTTGELARAMADALGRPARIVALPEAGARRVLALAGLEEVGRRLFGSLEVDDSAIRRELGWRPPTPWPAGLAATVAWYRGRPGGRP